MSVSPYIRLTVEDVLRQKVSVGTPVKVKLIDLLFCVSLHVYSQKIHVFAHSEDNYNVTDPESIGAG